MSPEEEKTLALLLKKQAEEKAGTAPVLQLLHGGGEKNAMADKLDEFSAMARRGELYDYAVVVVLSDTTKIRVAWGSQLPSLQICAAVGAAWLELNNNLRKG